MAVNTVFGTINGLSNAQLSHLVSVSPGIKRGNFGNLWNVFTEGNKEFYSEKNSLSPEDWKKLQNVGYAAEVDYLSGTNLGNTLGKLQYTTPKAVSDILNTRNVNTRDAEVEKLPEPDREIVNKINRAYSSNPEYTHAAQGRQFLEGSFTNGYVVFGRAIENLFHGDPTDLINLGLAFDTGGAALGRTARLGEEAGELAGVSRSAEGEAAGAGRPAEGATAEKNTGTQAKNNSGHEEKNPAEEDKQDGSGEKDEQESEEGGHDEGEDEESEACKESACTPTAGSPVNIALGIKVLAGKDDCDFAFPATVPLVWQRSYFSDETGNGWLGQGWFLPFSTYLREQGNRLVLCDEQGREIDFPRPGPGQPAHLHRREQIQVSQPAPGEFCMASDDGASRWCFAHPSGHGRWLLTAIRDRNGNQLTVSYNDRHLPESITDSAGRQFFITFSAVQLENNGSTERLTSVSVSLPSVPEKRELLCRYDYSAQGDLAAVRNGDGEVVREYRYRNHMMVGHVRTGDMECRYEYDHYAPSGRVISHTDSLGGNWRFDYGPEGTTVTDTLGRKEFYALDRRREVTGYRDAAGHTSLTQRNLRGQITCQTDAAGRVTRYQYDERGNMVTETGPDGLSTRIEYHPQFNLPVRTVNRAGGEKAFAYDSVGNLIREAGLNGETTEYQYDAGGNLIRITDGSGISRQMAYNAAGFLTGETDCSGQSTHYTYDRFGWLKTVTGADGQRMTRENDRNGRALRIIRNDGSVESFEYDSWGRMISATDVLGRRTALNPGISAYPNIPEGTVVFEYDKARRLTAVVNENGARHQLTYDECDRVTQAESVDGLRTRYRYDAAGWLLERRELGNEGGEITIRYCHDVSGYVTECWVVQNGQRHAWRARFEYDCLGRMTLARNRNGRTEFVRNEAGLLVSEIHIIRGKRFELSHEYDPRGNRTGTTLPDGRRLKHLYYGSGHHIQVNLDENIISQTERDMLHREIRRTQGALTSEYVYNDRGQLVNQRCAHQEGDTVISRLTRWRADGEVLQIQDSRGGDCDYDYDDAGRLSRAGNEGFSWDRAGNMAAGEHSRGIYPDNRVPESGGVRLTYDSFGRVTKRCTSSSEVLLRWDALHQLRASETVSGKDKRQITYGYDAFGRRTWKQEGNKVTLFVWDGDRLCCEEGKAGQQLFIYEPESYVPLARVCSRARAAGQLQTEWYHTDISGLPREMTGEDGRVVWCARYNAWGQRRADRVEEDTERMAQPLRYQGQYHDEETGLHYNRFRYYDPETGRYLSRDPAGLVGGLNAYQYTPNPLSWSDPLGLVREPLPGCAGGAPHVDELTNLEHFQLHPNDAHRAGYVHGYDVAKGGLNRLTIIGHGSPDVPGVQVPQAEGYTTKTVEDIYKDIQANNQPYDTIRLSACYSADNGTAQALANRTGVPVKGYSGIVRRKQNFQGLHPQSMQLRTFKVDNGYHYVPVEIWPEGMLNVPEGDIAGLIEGMLGDI